MSYRKSLLIALAVLLSSLSFAQKGQLPQIGAQVFIEPGQTPEQIDGWFKTLADHNMPVSRLFMLRNYIELGDGKWDWELYDAAFDAAEKYGVGIVATLMSNHGHPSQNKDFYYSAQQGRIDRSPEQLEASKKYISELVNRYKEHKALDTWMLYNEPGQLNAADALAMSRYKVWLKEKYGTIEKLNAMWYTNFSSFDDVEYHKVWDSSGAFAWPNSFLDWQRFWRGHLTWYMAWVAGQIREHDKKTPLHVNPHAVFEILPKYELPKWGEFLSSLGASIHPSWHFGLLERDQYALGVAGVCDIIGGSIEPKPFWVTELQGGNNTHSGMKPLCPTEKDIAQWVWTGIGSGAQRVVYWCLNHRKTGGEAGEWSLLDFQQNPTERLTTSADIANTIKDNAPFFTDAKAVKDKIYILLSPETMLILKRKDYWDDKEGRKPYAHVQSALAYYETLTELGYSPQFKQMDNFDWEKQEGAVAIVAHAIALNQSNIEGMKKFIAKKNKLIVSGLTGYFNEDEVAVVLDNPQPLEAVVGGKLRQVRLTKEQDAISVGKGKKAAVMPTHLWVGEITPGEGESIGKHNPLLDYHIATKRTLANGAEVTWVPSTIGLGAWLHGNEGLSKLLQQELSFLPKSEAPVSFKGLHPSILARHLKTKKGMVTIFTSSLETPKTIKLMKNTSLSPKVIYGTKAAYISSRDEVSIQAGETLVIRWE